MTGERDPADKPTSDGGPPDEPSDRLRPFEGVRLSKGTDRSRGWSALIRMFRLQSDPGDDAVGRENR